MAIYNLGSINIDKTYRLQHLPGPGETLAAYDLQVGLGGKGANMSVAAARAGAHVVHIGSVGSDGKWTVERLLEYGVDTRHIAVNQGETGHAIISVADDGENQIILWSGENHQLSDTFIQAGLETISPRDCFITQNETNGQVAASEIARSRGARIVYAAAPFEVAAVKQMLPILDVLVLNEVEAEQLQNGLGQSLSELGLNHIVVTLGSDGCRYVSEQGEQHFPAFPVEVIDTTGAGDTFTGYMIAGLDRGQPFEQAIRLGQKAGALMVGRLGTADVIPDLKEIEDAAF